MTDVPSNLIPTRITQLPEYEGDSTEGYTPYAVEGRTYKAKLANIVAPLADDVAIAAAAAEAARDAALAYKFQTEALVQDGADSALLAQAWAEGTEPGGPNTDSSKGWSYQSQGFALSLETDAAGGFYDSLAAGVADPAVEVGDAFNIIANGRHYVGQKTGPATGEIIAEYATTGFAEAISGPGGAGEVGTVDGVTVQEALDAFNQAAYIDFTDKTNGDPPAALDSGQSVDYIFDTTGRKPVISSGRLVVDTPPVSGGLADYYQATLDGPARRVGIEWTQPSGADNGYGAAVLIAWASIYTGTGNVPKSWCHITFQPGTGATGTAQWFVCNGTGNLISVKSQTFVNPAADGATRWRAEAVLDLPAGKGYCRLPDGSIMTLTNAEIAAFCTAITIPVFTFADVADCPVICAEHFAASNADTAKFCGFTALWGETDTSNAKPWLFKGLTALDTMQSDRYLLDKIPPSSNAKTYAPSTMFTAATTTGTTNVDATNAVLSCRAGAEGKITFVITAYYEWTGTDTVYWRLIGAGPATALRAAGLGVSGDKKTLTVTEAVTGLTPGTLYTATLQHSSINGALATLKAGGSGGAMVPPLSIAAFPA